MKKEKQKRPMKLRTARWKAKIASALVVALLAANVTPAAVPGHSLRQKEEGLEESRATDANASKSNMQLKKQVKAIGRSAEEGIEAQAAAESGEIGNLTWEFKEDTLTISGSGEMKDFTWEPDRYWQDPNKKIFSRIQHIVIEDGVTSIGNYAFYRCEKLTSVQLPESITRIGQHAFSGCTALESIEIPKKVTEIPYSAFLQCTNLRHVTLPEGLIRIGGAAFSGCTNLKEITIPENIRRIENRAFWNTGFSSVVIPAKYLEYFGVNNFSETTEITFKRPEDAEAKPLKSTGMKSFIRSYNEHAQNYSWNWSAVIHSYLYEGEDNTFYRVCYTSKKLVIEQYQSDYRFIQSWSVPLELPIFGGFYAGEDALYIVFGQYNLKEDDSAEVVRVVKYTKEMERIMSASIYGAHTTKPFDASSLRMAEDKDYLYIYTGRENYQSSDGLNHQSSLSFILYKEAMLRADDSGFSASHSFNQFIAIDEDRIVVVDHGDAYPRSIQISMSSRDLRLGEMAGIGSEYTSGKLNLLSISGETGDNYTGVTVGGLEISDSSYLVAGNTIDQSNFTKSKTKNIFLSVTDKKQMTSEGYSPEYIQVTDYEEGGIYNTTTPQLVKLSENLFVLMWEELENSNYNGIVKAAFFDGDGRWLGNKKIYEFEGALSDCKPVLLDGEVTWYVADGEELHFYHFPAQEPDRNGIKVEKTTLVMPERNLVLPAVEADKITQNSVTLNKAVAEQAENIGDENLMYGWALEDDSYQVRNWQYGTEFTGLNSGKTYYFFASILGGDYYKKSFSKALVVKTKSESSSGSGNAGGSGSGSGSGNSGGSGSGSGDSSGSGNGSGSGSGDSSGSGNGSGSGDSSGSGSGSGDSSGSGSGSGSGDSGGSSSGSGNSSGSDSGSSSGNSGGSSSGSGGSGGSGSGSSSGSGSGGSSSSGGSGGGGGSRGGGGGGGSRGTVSGGSTSGGPGGPGTSSASLPDYVEMGQWVMINGVWRFADTYGNIKANTWTAAYNPYAGAGQQNYDWFRFDAYGNMLTGWFLDYDGNWYFLNPASDGTQGRMMTGWVWVMDGFGVQRCYYFNPVSDGTRGKMMTNTIVDGYTIDANGCWTVNGIQQIK